MYFPFNFGAIIKCLTIYFFVALKFCYFVYFDYLTQVLCGLPLNF